MEYEIIQAAQRTTIDDNFLAIKNCAIRLKGNIPLNEHETLDYIDLLQDIIAVIQTQVATQTQAKQPKKWNFSKFREDIDRLFEAHTKIYYAVIVCMLLPPMLMLSIIAS